MLTVPCRVVLPVWRGTMLPRRLMWPIKSLNVLRVGIVITAVVLVLAKKVLKVERVKGCLARTVVGGMVRVPLWSLWRTMNI